LGVRYLDATAIEPDIASVGAVETRNDLDEGAFAGSIGAPSNA
jgi:hypothetical protein